MKGKFFTLCFLLSIVAIPTQAFTLQKVAKKQEVFLAGSIDLNKADLSSLIHSFKGIGKKRAEAILAYRDSHQGFKSIEEFAEIKGFGQRFLEANREKLKKVFVIH